MHLQIQLICQYLEKKIEDFFRKENVNKYRTEAENGDTGSMELIGDCYLLGIGVEKNIQKALDWYKKCDAI